MVNFEDGELVKGAYVVIDGKEYEVHMPQYSGRTPLSSENLNKMQVEILKTMLPVGSRYVTQDNTNPNEILGFGTWERLKGKVCYVDDAGQIHVNWENGSSLAVLPEVDSFHKIGEPHKRKEHDMQR